MRTLLTTTTSLFAAYQPVRTVLVTSVKPPEVLERIRGLVENQLSIVPVCPDGSKSFCGHVTDNKFHLYQTSVNSDALVYVDGEVSPGLSGTDIMLCVLWSKQLVPLLQLGFGFLVFFQIVLLVNLSFSEVLSIYEYFVALIPLGGLLYLRKYWNSILTEYQTKSAFYIEYLGDLLESRQLDTLPDGTGSID